VNASEANGSEGNRMGAKGSEWKRMKRSEGKGSLTILTWLYYVRCAVHGRPFSLLAILGCDFDRDPFGGIDL